jgi:RND family efflux transporter MFP subunit
MSEKSNQRHASLGIHSLPPGVQRVRMLKRARKAALIGLGALGMASLVVIGVRMSQAAALAETAREQGVRHVKVVLPKPASGDSETRLPGTLQGFTEAPIYARTNGYVSRWLKDIGDTVKQGELLAVIDTPELAQQVQEAKAVQVQAANNLQLARSSFERWEALRKSNAVSQQELDERRNALAVATAAEAAASAAVRRLQEQLGYSRIIAPFSGVVTRRNIDIGSLVDAGGNNRLLFMLAKNDPLRVYIYVPQSYAARIRPGDAAVVSLREMSGEEFTGKIVRSAGAIDTQTRTLQVEVNLPNPEGRLLPGAFVQVAIQSQGAAAEGLTLPGNTLLFRPNGIHVATVDGEGRARLLPVKIVRELGARVEVGGLAANQQIIINPPDALADGDRVRVVIDPPAADKPAADKAVK